jgi:hypothetical protein
VDRVNGVHDELMDRAAHLKGDAAFAKRLSDTAQKIEEIRRKIVATKEGGAVTGEERIREKTTGLYGNILNYDGRPGDYQIARIDSLKRELDDARKEFDDLLAKESPAINKLLKQKRLQPIEPLTRKAWDAANADDSGGSPPPGGRWERD